MNKKIPMTAALLLGAVTFVNAQSLADAIKLTEKEQFEQADAAFDRLLAADPANAEAWFYRGENFFANEHLDSALISFDRGIVANANFPLNHAGKGKVLRALGRKADATAPLDRAIALATEKANKFPKPAVSNAYREVAAALLEGADKDFATAQTHLTKAVELDPKNARAFVLRGDAYFEQNPRDGTTPLDNYKQAINLEPLNPLPVSRKAFMYYRANNFQGAIAEYGNAIALDAAFAPAYRGRAEAYLKAREFDKAAADMNKYLELNSANMSARVRQAQFLFLVGKYDESLNEINALEAKGVKNVTLKRMKAYDLTEKGDFAAAHAAMEAYYAEQPVDKRIALDHEYMGKIYLGMAKAVNEGQARGTNGNTTGVVTNPDGTSTLTFKPAPYDSLAAEEFLLGARMDRTKEHLFIEAGKAFSQARAHDRAIAAYREKIAAKPEVNDWYYLGNVANRAKRFDVADSAWTQYIAKQPNIYQGYLYRARAKAGADTADVKTWAAKADYEEALRKMKPEERDRAKADYEEALNFMGLYFLYDKTAMDRAKAKCFFEKVSALNANTSITKQVNEVFLKMKELKDVAPGDCEVL